MELTKKANAKINLTLNITFVLTLPDKYKLDGVILSTVIADVFIEIPWESYAVFTSFFGGKEARYYWKRQSMYTLLAILVCSVTWGTAYLIPVKGFSGFFLKGAASAAVSSILLLVFLRDDARLVFEEIRNHVRK